MKGVKRIVFIWTMLEDRVLKNMFDNNQLK